MSCYQLSIESRLHPGLVRENNEDALLTVPELGLAILADGMGGYNAGEVASQLAVDSIATAFTQRPQAGSETDTLNAAVQQANMEIFAATQAAPEFDGMGTTVVAAMFADDQVFAAYVGDSRLYRYRDGQLEQLSRDHSVIQELVDVGVFPNIREAELAGVRGNVLTRALGIDATVDIGVVNTDAQAGDIFLLCSDGLTSLAQDDAIVEKIRSANHDIGRAADDLLDLACSNGGTDNISIILVRIKGQGSDAATVQTSEDG